MRLLFVCACNRPRNPTAERVFAAVPGVEAESAGVAPDAESPVTPELLEWADVILVMEPAHRSKLAKRFSNALRAKRIVCLDVPDGYAHMGPELVELLWERGGDRQRPRPHQQVGPHTVKPSRSRPGGFRTGAPKLIVVHQALSI